MVNKTEKVRNLQKAISLRLIKVCRFEIHVILDSVRYVYCIKHAYKSSEGTSRVYGRSLTLASMCFLFLICYILFWQLMLFDSKLNSENKTYEYEISHNHAV